MESLDIAVETMIPGVKPAEQARSRVLQDKFVAAGQTLLSDKHLSELSVADLAKEAGSSVGGFYSRFEDKDVFFEFLRARMLKEHGDAYAEELSVERLADATVFETSRAFIDVITKVYSGPWRGVLREAYTRIPEKKGFWGPMRLTGARLSEAMVALLGPKLPDPEAAESRIAFAMQMTFSMLNNELVNPNLRYSIADTDFREYLTQMFHGFLAEGGRGEPMG